MTDTVITHRKNQEPTEFTLAMLDWLPWLAPPEEAALTERQRASLVDAGRSKSAYFRLLARDPDILEARTLLIWATFSSIPKLRAERELSAAATSRHNGCIYCASVHARHTVTYSKRSEDVRRCSILGSVLANGGTPSSPVPWHSPRRQYRGEQLPARGGTGRCRDRRRGQQRGFFNWANRLACWVNLRNPGTDRIAARRYQGKRFDTVPAKANSRCSISSGTKQA